MNKLVCIRADASNSIGGGHLMRCRVLADILHAQGCQCTFAVKAESLSIIPNLSSSFHQILVLTSDEENEANEIKHNIGVCDWLIVDHYERDLTFEQQARSFAKKILVIDDLANRKHDCDILLDQTFGRRASDYDGLVAKNTQMLIGMEFILLRPEFKELRARALNQHKIITRPLNVLVCLGATDPNGITTKILKALGESRLDISIDVVTGTMDPTSTGLFQIAQQITQNVRFHDFNANMAELMTYSDFGIMSAGGTTWERMSLGLVGSVFIVSDGQRQIAQSLCQEGYQFVAGDITNPDQIDLQPLRDACAGKLTSYADISKRCSQLVDGRGANKVVEALNA